jgi:predicted nuclease of predicted toxin-antitoxin system
VRWLADECISARLVKRLRDEGHDVAYAAEMAAGVIDTDLIALANRDGRLLLTDDKDFGELVIRRQWIVPGLVFMRIVSEHPQIRWERLRAAILQFGDSLYGRYTVVEGARFRFRPLRSIDHET